jgi:hypothetical protein
MKNDRLNGSCWLSVFGCWRNTKGLPFSYLPYLAFTLVLTLLVTPPLFAQQRWQKTYGGRASDYGSSVRQTTDGGYIIAGTTGSFGVGGSVYLIKTNTFGDTLWTKALGGDSTDAGYSVQQTSDGGYIIAGMTNYSSTGTGDVYLIKTNAFGDTLWAKAFGGDSTDAGYSVQQTPDGGYIIAGFTISFGAGGYDVYLIKTNVSGDTLWTRTYGGTDDDYGYSVQQTLDGGYIIAGTTDSYGAGFRNVYLIKTNSQGDTLWTRTYGGTGYDMGYSVQQTSDGGYIVAGVTGSFGINGNVYLIKTNATGDTLWTRNYGGMDNEWGQSVQQTSDGGYIIAGFTCFYMARTYNVYLIKTNATGDTLWTRNYGGIRDDWGCSVQQTSDGGYIIAGFTWSFGVGNEDIYLIKTDAFGNSGVEEKPEGNGQKAVSRIKIMPNPFTSFAEVPGQEKETFELYDIAGRRVGTYRGDRIGANLPAGVYFLRSSGKTSTPVRIVKVR